MLQLHVSGQQVHCLKGATYIRGLTVCWKQVIMRWIDSRVNNITKTMIYKHRHINCLQLIIHNNKEWCGKNDALPFSEMKFRESGTKADQQELYQLVWNLTVPLHLKNVGWHSNIILAFKLIYAYTDLCNKCMNVPWLYDCFFELNLRHYVLHGMLAGGYKGNYQYYNRFIPKSMIS